MRKKRNDSYSYSRKYTNINPNFIDNDKLTYFGHLKVNKYTLRGYLRIMNIR